MNWKEIARDCRAFGSVPFYFIVAARALVGPYWDFLTQLLIAAACLLLINRIVKGDLHISRALVLWTFTALFYKEIYYTLFSAVLLGGIMIASRHLKIHWKNLLTGAGVGAVATGLAYLAAPLI